MSGTPPDLERVDPTAVHAAGPGQDTPSREPLTSGLLRVLQPEPVHSPRRGRVPTLGTG
jgi:hypothetical protein